MTIENNFQRRGALSNAHVGKAFEDVALRYFSDRGIALTRGFAVQVGVSTKKKPRSFDLGSEDQQILVECKPHRWTVGNNVPSAKITVWNEAMYYFDVAPMHYRKILFVLKDHSPSRDCTLAEYYVRNYDHLIPDGVEIVEFDEETGTVTVYPLPAVQVHSTNSAARPGAIAWITAPVRPRQRQEVG
jgi:hypothetical protein